MKTIPEIVEILQGFEAGRKVVFWSEHNDFWFEVDDMGMLLKCILHDDDIRLAPEPKLVPYGPEDATWLVGRKAMSKTSGAIRMIIEVDHDQFEFPGSRGSLEDLLILDLDVTDNPNGVPFGKVVDHA